jgi:redox-sensing transcriptional repressor
VAELIDILEQFLGYRRVDDAFLIGAGHLGLALLGYEGFKERGLNIVAAFDTDPDKIGKRFHGKEILHIDKFTKLVERMKIPIGILTVPAHEAQKITDMMVNAGIKAIWSFAPVHIHVPPDVIVQHENLASSLVVLSKKLTTKLAHKEEA